jgi:hypothetical protein
MAVDNASLATAAVSSAMRAVMHVVACWTEGGSGFERTAPSRKATRNFLTLVAGSTWK